MSMLEVYMKNNKSGNYHLGKMFLDCMLRKPPDGICQIDAATGAEESNASVLARSIRLARCFRRLGLQPGDVLALGGRNHLDLHIPYYAAMYNGLPVVGVDPFFKYDEIKLLFKLTKPTIAFCQEEMRDMYARAAQDLGLEVKIVTFDGSECTLSKFMDTYDETDSTDDFQAADFDTDKVYAWLVSTSGTSGMPKVAAFKHKPLINRCIALLGMTKVDYSVSKLALSLSPVQWFGSFLNAFGIPLMNNIKLQTSRPDDVNHIIDIINEYKPLRILASPPLVSLILKGDKECDLSCFRVVTLTGSKLYMETLLELKSRLHPDAKLTEVYGQTETIGQMLLPNPSGPLGSCGVPLMPSVAVKLVDPETGKEITEPNVTGEMWTKGRGFEEYYNDPEATKSAFSEDGWFKTGDLLYRDEHNNYYFVDRLKMLIKYKLYHIIPPELEEVIVTHPGVLEVCVTGISHPVDGERPIACVVRRTGYDVTAHEIKELVASKLSEKKQLHGVVFLDELPKTSTGKVARTKLKNVVVLADE